MNGSHGNRAAPVLRARPSLLSGLAEFRAACALTSSARNAREVVRIIQRFCWEVGTTEAHELTTQAVRAWLVAQSAEGRSPRTLRNYRSALSVWCEWLIDEGLIEENPCRRIRLPRVEKLPPRYLSPVEIHECLHIARRIGLHVEVALALSTGMRLSEMRLLEWADVHLERKVLTVRRSKSRRFRTMPLCRTARAALRQQHKRTGHLSCVFPRRQTWTGGWKWVDTPRSAWWWCQALRPIQEAIPKFRELPGKSTSRGWHLFRHTFASHHAQAGIGIVTLASWLGHTSLRATEIYAHAAEGYDPKIERGGL